MTLFSKSKQTEKVEIFNSCSRKDDVCVCVWNMRRRCCALQAKQTPLSELQRTQWSEFSSSASHRRTRSRWRQKVSWSSAVIQTPALILASHQPTSAAPVKVGEFTSDSVGILNNWTPKSSVMSQLKWKHKWGVTPLRVSFINDG